MPSQWERTKEAIAPRPIISYVEQQNPSQLFFGLDRHAHEATIESHERCGERFFAVAAMSPCLITYNRGKLRESKKLGLSNLCAYWEYPSKDAKTLLDKDPEFINWAKRVFGWVRKLAPKQIEINGRACRATDRVKDALRTGSFEAVLY